MCYIPCKCDSDFGNWSTFFGCFFWFFGRPCFFFIIMAPCRFFWLWKSIFTPCKNFLPFRSFTGFCKIKIFLIIKLSQQTAIFGAFIEFWFSKFLYAFLADSKDMYLFYSRATLLVAIFLCFWLSERLLRFLDFSW